MKYIKDEVFLYKYENLFEIDGLINRPFGENSPKITEMNKLHE